jgi:peptidoglycan/xylan/chitin deacetylase (PgdA/CDA1 family)
MLRRSAFALLAAACSAAPSPTANAPAAVRAAPPELKLAAASAPRLAPPGRALGPGERFAAPHVDVDDEALALVEPEATRAVTLLYHAFDVGPDPLGLSSRRFEAHLERLSADGVAIVPLSALIEFLEGKRRLPARVAVITIDDAHESVYEKAFPILVERRIPFTLGVPTAYVGDQRSPTLAWSQIREMVATGLCEVASHGHHHRRLDVLDERSASDELETSRRLIERETGVKPLAYFYPMGHTSARAEERVERAGYRAAFGATGGAIAFGHFSTYAVPRTTVQHGDDPRRVAWLFSPKFLERLPLRSSSDIRSERAVLRP